MRVTIRDVAKAANVSHATVSRALNRASDPFISDATRNRIIETARQMGYQPNRAARALVTGRTGQISLCLWTENIHNSYQWNVTHVAHAVMQSRSYELLVNLVGYKTLELAEKNLVSPPSVDGIICYEAAPALGAMFGGALPAHLPIVTAGTYNLLHGVDRVAIDLSEGSFDAMRHLIGQGRKRIAYLTNDKSVNKDPRYIAYVSSMNEAGLPLEIIETPSGRAGPRLLIGQYVAERGAPDAIFCHNDDIAIGAYRGLRDVGLGVPEDVAVVGCDGLEDTEYLDNPISTIVQPLARVLELSCEYVLARIDNPDRPIESTVIKSKFVARESSGG